MGAPLATTGRLAALAALLATAALMAVRHRIYASRPATAPCAEVSWCASWARGEPDAEALLRSPAFQPSAWSRRDALMTWPRLAVLLGCWAAASTLGGLRRWGWGGRPSGRALSLLAVAAFGTVLGQIGGGPRLFAPAEMSIGALATIPVALWEELCYRGLLYRGLRGELSPRAAALASSAVFVVMHWEAQSAASWPAIGAYGLIACAASEQGAGLGLLAAVHWAADSTYFLALGRDHSRALFAAASTVLLAGAVWAWDELPRGGAD